MKYRNRIFFIIAVIVFILFFYANGYRLSALHASRAHFAVTDDAELVEELDFGWAKVHLFQSAEGPRTILAEKQGILWRSSTAVHFKPSHDPIKTIGWLCYNDKNHALTVFAVETTDPKIAYIEINAGGTATHKSIEPDIPLIISWNKTIDFNDLNPTAYDEAGVPLYEYRYPDDRHLNTEDLKWYAIDGNVNGDYETEPWFEIKKSNRDGWLVFRALNPQTLVPNDSGSYIYDNTIGPFPYTFEFPETWTPPDTYGSVFYDGNNKILELTGVIVGERHQIFEPDYPGDYGDLTVIEEHETFMINELEVHRHIVRATFLTHDAPGKGEYEDVSIYRHVVINEALSTNITFWEPVESDSNQSVFNEVIRSFRFE